MRHAEIDIARHRNRKIGGDNVSDDSAYIDILELRGVRSRIGTRKTQHLADEIRASDNTRTHFFKALHIDGVNRMPQIIRLQLQCGNRRTQFVCGTAINLVTNGERALEPGSNLARHEEGHKKPSLITKYFRQSIPIPGGAFQYDAKR